MGTIWKKLVDAHINTVLGCVTWEDIEPVEGKFDFTELDKVVDGARAHGLHLVLLWFGSFKNGMQDKGFEIEQCLTGSRTFVIYTLLDEEGRQAIPKSSFEKIRRHPQDG